ncbi:hypothetical protein LC162_24995 [Escherichia coli]
MFLNFHNFNLYIHNNTINTLKHPQNIFSNTTIQLQPIFTQ